MRREPQTPLEHTVRDAARIALWTSLALSLLALAALSRLAKPRGFGAETRAISADQELWEGIDFETFPEVRLLQAYVRIDTSHPDPDEVAGAEFLAAQLAALGVPSTIERLGERRANLWAFVEGEDPRAAVLHHHIDVEETLESVESWSYPPFGGVVDGPWIYGRGMYDMKSLAIAQLAAIEAVVKSGRRPRRSLLFLATSGEEIGSDTGTRWILRHHPELVARMDVVLTEGGVVETLGPNEVKYWGIEFAQKRFGHLDLCSSDRGRLEALDAELRREAQSEPRTPIAPEIQTFLEAYGPTRSERHFHRLLADPAALARRPGEVRKLPPFLRSLFRDEVMPLRLTEEPDGSFRLPLAVHLLPGSELEEVVAELLPPWRTFGVGVSPPFTRTGEAAASPVDHPAFLAAQRALRGAFPEAPIGPYYLPWGSTDSRYFRAAGVPSFGVSPFLIGVTDTFRVGKADERLQLPGFVRGIPIYQRLVADLVE